MPDELGLLGAKFSLAVGIVCGTFGVDCGSFQGQIRSLMYWFQRAGDICEASAGGLVRTWIVPFLMENFLTMQITHFDEHQLHIKEWSSYYPSMLNSTVMAEREHVKEWPEMLAKPLVACSPDLS